MVTIRVNRIERTIDTVTVYIDLIDPVNDLTGKFRDPKVVTYPITMFNGMTKQQIRSTIIDDLKGKFKPPSIADTTVTSGFTAGEVIDLNA